MVPLADDTGVQADVRKLPKRTDDIENGLNLMKLKNASQEVTGRKAEKY